jgi:hypothetical protein
MTAKAKISISFLVALAVFQIWAFLTIPEAMFYFGDPPMPDVRAGGYSADEIRQVLEQIGEEGRATYLSAQNKIDWIIPVLGMGMFVMAIWALAEGLSVGGASLTGGQAFLVACIGFGSGLFDLSENVLIARVMTAGPDNFSPRLVEIASVCTQFKYTFVVLSIITVLVLAALRWKQSRQ